MQRLFAIAWLTIKAAIRYKLVLILSVVLLAAVILLPLILHHDGSARGLTQITITYTVSLVSLLLGFTTLWLSCGTLARELEESQLQMVVVKPVGRWQIWLGKWLGIMVINGFLLAISGLAVFLLLQYRTSQLSEKERQILREEVMVARASAKPPMPDFKAEAEKLLQDRLQNMPKGEKPDIEAMRLYAQERVRAEMQVVRPGYVREWRVDLSDKKESIKDQPMFLRVKFNSASPKEGATYVTIWEVGDEKEKKVFRNESSIGSESFFEFPIPPAAVNQEGILFVRFLNTNETPLIFTLEEGLEVLYREGGFALNFSRGLFIIFCWIALLASIGLAASSLLSFPVAAFFTIGILILSFSTNTLKQVIDEGGFTDVNHETGTVTDPSILDHIAVPVARAALELIQVARGFSPVDSLSSGRSVTWGDALKALLNVVFGLGGVFSCIGIYILSRRELALAQSNH